MDSILFLSAAALSALWCGVHIIIGGRECVAPLRHDTALPDVSRQTLRLCWHFVSATLATMAAFFAMGAAGAPGFGPAATSLAAAFALVGLIHAPLVGQRFAVLPQGWLFVPVAALGLAGCLP